MVNISKTTFLYKNGIQLWLLHEHTVFLKIYIFRNLPLYVSAHRKTAAATKLVISTHDDENVYLKGHVIRGKRKFF